MKSHKYGCSNTNTQVKLYKFIRETGGWENWSMQMLNFFNCANRTEALQKEQEYFVSLKATLNSIEPLPEPKTKAKEEVVEVNEAENVENAEEADEVENDEEAEEVENAEEAEEVENAEETEDVGRGTNGHKFSCNMCDYHCSNKFNYNKHLSTRKHINANTQTNETPQTTDFTCENCNNTYKHQSGLCRHKRTCNAQVVTPVETNTPPAPETPQPTETQILIRLLSEMIKNNAETQRTQLETQRTQLETQRQNLELQKQVIELYKNKIDEIYNSTNL
jgi:vacuolar-type H+-ATPase subunit I/STV1